ncbi:MAG: MlaD family protein [Solirubrobacteraceae bacterium]
MHVGTVTWRRMLFPLFMLLLCGVLALLLWRAFGGGVPLEATPYRVTIALPQSSNLYAHSDVRIAGVSVGRVADVRQNGRQALVAIELDPIAVPLRTDARAILRTKTLLGEAYLEITPGAPDGAAIPEGGRLRADRVVAAQQLSDLLKTFDPPTRRRVRRLAAGLARGVGGRGADANAGLAVLPSTVGGLELLLETLDGQRRDLRTLVASSARVLETVAGRSDALGTLVRSADQVLTTTASRRDSLAATIGALPPFLRSVRSAAATVERATGDLTRATRAVRPLAPLLVPVLDEIDATMVGARRLLDDVPALVTAARRGLPSIQAMLDAGGRASGPLYEALREVIPLARLASANAGVMVASYSGIAALANGKAWGPGGQILSYLAGIPTFGNETPAAWDKRLPTNRGNPYPRPGSQLDIARPEGLKSYDCRNLGNTLWMPPLGSTPAGCTEQGAWAFDGRTQQYPRLPRAEP